MTDPAPRSRHRLYGRAAGKPLSQRQKRLVSDLGSQLAIAEAGPQSLNPASLFSPVPAGVWLEIGSGGGEHLAAQAARHPQTGFIAAEPFIDGIAKLLTAIEEQGLSNIRIRRGDARDLIASLADVSLERIFILFPDPWPKTRHAKRRLIQPDVVAELARCLKPGGRLRFATDWADYANRALADILSDGRFDWQATRADDWRTPPADHVTTRYQEKGLGDCAPVFFDFVRRGT